MQPYGWFGSPQDPLAGIFLVPLGLPWNRLLGGLPSAMLPAAVIAAPGLNLMLLWALCRWRGGDDRMLHLGMRRNGWH